MKKEFKLLMLVLIINSSLVAQPASITGKVMHKDSNEKLVGVTVTIKGTTEATMTDDNGNFKLTTKKNFPLTLVFSSSGFETQEQEFQSANEINILLNPAILPIEEIVIGGNRIATRLIDVPVTVERIGARQIVNAPASSYYDMAGNLKGVDLTTSSLTFKTISTRGFNGSGSSRVNQLVDGMDNQAPGLNFFVGNFLGLTELDVDNMEILSGASSALYGPGGMNGTVLINSKSPFKYPGLSVQVKQGVMNVDKSQRDKATAFYDYSFRWAQSFKNKIAFKIGGQYIKATDWLAGDTSNYQRSGTIGKVVPGTRQTDPNYDGVNVYGDEISTDLRLFFEPAILLNPQLEPVLSPFLTNPQAVSRTGYHEKDLVDPETKNIKISGALHYKFTDRLEGILAGYWATGNSVYTGNNRYALKDIKLGQYKVELKHSNWFLRSFTTQEDAGEAYSATLTPIYLNEAWKRSLDPNNLDGSWYPQYTQSFITQAATVYQQKFMESVNAGMSQQEAMAAAQNAVINGAPQFHVGARAIADMGRPVPGSREFKQLFDAVRKVPIPNGGLFVEKSQLWMTEGQYNLSNLVKVADVIVGANYKKYILDSDGTLFIDEPGHPITFNEIGAYAQVTKKLLNDVLTLSASGRYDKNEDFKGQFTPRATALIKVAENNNIRLSYQTAYRFATTQQKYIMLDVGEYTLLGGLPWIMDTMNAKSHTIIDLGTMQPFVYRELKPENMRSFEVGYKGAIADKLLIDAYAYMGKYENFLGRNAVYVVEKDKVYSTVLNSNTNVKTHGYGLGIEYALPSNFKVFFNGYSDELTDVPQGFQSYFNTPKYRANAGFSNAGLGKSKRIGFNIVWRWQDAFNWDGELANGAIPAFHTIDGQVNYKFPKIKSMIKIGGTNLLNSYYKNGFGNPSIGGLYYASFGFNIL